MYECMYVCMYVCMYTCIHVLLEIDIDPWEVLAGNRNEWRRSVKTGCNSLELKRLDYAELMRNLRKRTIRGVPGDVNSQ